MSSSQPKVAIVTGASRGIGAVIAKQLAAEGFAVVINYASSAGEATQLVAQLREDGHEAIAVQADVANAADVKRLFDEAERQLGKVDVLINNAGHGLNGSFLDQPLDYSLAMIDLDIASLTAMTYLFGRDMRSRKTGSILMVASLLSYQGVKNFAVYSAAKAYVLRISEALHRELKSDGVIVTALCPGMSDTGFAERAKQTLTPALKMIMMDPQPVVRAGIRALQAGRMSVVPGFSNKAITALTWATPRWLHQSIMSAVMGR